MAQIIELSTAVQVLECIGKTPADWVAIFDIDDTIIAPASAAMRADKLMIDRIKFGPDRPENYIDVVSNWRLQRKVVLVDIDWQRVLSKISDSHRVYALTKMDVGKFGVIKSMEIWRVDELYNMGIDFSSLAPALPNDLQHGDNGPKFLRGILFTGSAGKGKTLAFYHQYLSPKGIVMVDDRVDYLKDVAKYCDAYRVEFLGILFTGAEKLPGTTTPEIISFQRDYLLKHSIWLEDDQVKELC